MKLFLCEKKHSVDIYLVTNNIPLLNNDYYYLFSTTTKNPCTCMTRAHYPSYTCN